MCLSKCAVQVCKQPDHQACFACRGQVATLKLSPNLRKYTKGENRSAFIMAEQSKLQAVLTVARKRAEAYDKALKGLSYDI